MTYILCQVLFCMYVKLMILRVTSHCKSLFLHVREEFLGRYVLNNFKILRKIVRYIDKYVLHIKVKYHRRKPQKNGVMLHECIYLANIRLFHNRKQNSAF